MSKLNKLWEFQAKLIHNRIMTEFVFPLWYRCDAGLCNEDKTDIMWWDSDTANVKCTFDKEKELTIIYATVLADREEWDIKVAIYFSNPWDCGSSQSDYHIGVHCHHQAVDGSYGDCGVEYAMTHHPAIADWNAMTEVCDNLKILWNKIRGGELKLINLVTASVDAPNDEPLDLGGVFGFSDDEAKMADFAILTKAEFLASYSYLTEEEYDVTRKEQE